MLTVGGAEVMMRILPDMVSVMEGEDKEGGRETGREGREGREGGKEGEWQERCSGGIPGTQSPISSWGGRHQPPSCVPTHRGCRALRVRCVPASRAGTLRGRCAP